MQTVKADGLRVKYTTHRPKRIEGMSLPLLNFKQQDNHSCGFLAALTVARYYDPGIDDLAVLLAVRPSFDHGTSRRKMIGGLAQLGISAAYCDTMTVEALRLCVRGRVPVIISVLPDHWAGDHWVVVQGFGQGRVYLTNHWSLRVRDFKREWIHNWDEGPLGAGLVCTRTI